MIRLILILCLIPSLAFAKASILKFKDGSSSCGSYHVKKASYCKKVSGGEICWSKKEVVSVKKVKDCESYDETAGARGSRKGR
jgi:hypothetical protein